MLLMHITAISIMFLVVNTGIINLLSYIGINSKEMKIVVIPWNNKDEVEGSNDCYRAPHREEKKAEVRPITMS